MASHGSSFQKTFMGAAAAGEVLNVEDVFSTYLYEGNGSTQTITNGIDLSGEGGLNWIKNRDATDSHILTDTARGVTKVLKSNTPVTAETTDADTVTAFSSTGFSLGDDVKVNTNNESYCSWTFRKAPKFFDIVTYTGNGTAGRTVSHNLGSVPGFMILKRIDEGTSWAIYHRGLNGGSSPEDFVLVFDTDAQADYDGAFNDTAPTATEFTVGNWASVNNSGSSFIAYLFAHNDGDGEFGPDSDQDIIKCGYYTGNASTNGPEINLGFEPQWLMVKNAGSTGSWVISDVMRGFNVTDTQNLIADDTATETSADIGHYAEPTSTGFKLVSSSASSNQNNTNFIYIAIRRGTKVPESATEVFDVNQTTSNQSVTTGFPVDLQLGQYTGGGSTYVVDRMRGMSTSTTGSMKYLTTQSTGAEASNTGSLGFNGFVQNGFSHTLGNYEQALWSWKRAPNYMDVVAYTGDGTSSNSNRAAAIPHNLGVQPEMIWVKSRSSSSEWVVAHKNYGAGYLNLNNSFATFPISGISFNAAFTATNFKLNGWQQEANFNYSDRTYIAYLFASLDGVSKVGSVSHSGSSTDVNCGFSNGARFVILKRTDATGDWYVWDSVRGIIAGNDPYLLLNTTAAEVTNTDYIDPLSSGFQISGDSTDGDYIFYAIA